MGFIIGVNKLVDAFYLLQYVFNVKNSAMPFQS